MYCVGCIAHACLMLLCNLLERSIPRGHIVYKVFVSLDRGQDDVCVSLERVSIHPVALCVILNKVDRVITIIIKPTWFP